MARGQTLLIATAGGHLTQMSALASRLGVDPAEALWVTVPTTQSQSLLTGRQVVWARYTRPRDLLGLLGHVRLAEQTVRTGNFRMAVSTGASLAPPFLAVARRHGVACHYIESATRVDGPSMSGRLVARIPGVKLYTQYEGWARGRWAYRGSIFDGWTCLERDAVRSVRRVLDTVGSARGYPFIRMLNAIRDALPAGCEVVWQVLDSQVEGLRGTVVEELEAGELQEVLRSVDVVVSHAGTGSALTALQAGLCPILIPRSARHGEHIDEHQSQIAAMLLARDLAIVRSPDELTSNDFFLAANRVAVEIPGPSFDLIP